MIDSLQRTAALYPYIEGKSFYEVYPPYFMMDMPYGKHPYHHCILGGGHMSEATMTMDETIKPFGVCKECWGFTVSEFIDICLVCGDGLEDIIIEYQQQHPLDYRYRMHNGKCINAFAAVVARALGYDTGFLEGCPIPKAKLPYPDVLPFEVNNQHTPLEIMRGNQLDLSYTCCASEIDVICACHYAENNGFDIHQSDYPMANPSPIIVKGCRVTELPAPRPLMLSGPKLKKLP